MSEETKRCPFCAEEILAAAKKCKHCGEFLYGPTPSRPSTDPSPDPGRITASPARRVLAFTFGGTTLLIIIIVGVLVALVGYKVFDQWTKQRALEQFNADLRETARRYSKETDRQIEAMQKGGGMTFSNGAPVAPATPQVDHPLSLLVENVQLQRDLVFADQAIRGDFSDLNALVTQTYEVGPVEPTNDGECYVIRLKRDDTPSREFRAVVRRAGETWEQCSSTGFFGEHPPARLDDEFFTEARISEYVKANVEKFYPRGMMRFDQALAVSGVCNTMTTGRLIAALKKRENVRPFTDIYIVEEIKKGEVSMLHDEVIGMRYRVGDSPEVKTLMLQ